MHAKSIQVMSDPVVCSLQGSSGLSFLSPGDLLDPEVEPGPLMSLALAGRFFTTSAT